MTSGKKYLGGGTAVPGQQFEYVFDDIGNRKSTKAGGEDTGANLRSATYTPTLLNQYASRTVPGGFDVLGIADASGTVSVNGTSSGVVRQGQYFRKEVTVSNGSVPVWQSVSVSSTGGGSAGSGNVFVPKTPEVYDDTATPAVNEGYDADGNQLRDGRWDYAWDAENRLLRLQARTAAGPQQRIDFAYDYMGRQVVKKVWNNTAGTGTPALELRFVYDRWNLVAELNSALAVQRSYVWGLDLSRTMQGAGGVGGLLMVRDHGAGTIHATGYDGNGNVMALVDASTGNTTAWYEYGPFGEPLRATGTMGRSNPFRFSTKYTDEESDLVYYGYRYYSPSTGKWANKDPIEELGGLNQYGFVANDPVLEFDPSGLDYSGPSWPPSKPYFPPYIPPIPRPDPNKQPGFAICQRDINVTDFWDKCVNVCGGQHRYIQHFDGDTRWGYGFSDSGVKPELIFNPSSCSPCKPSTAILEHGSGKGKRGVDAMAGEIKDCIAKTPAKRSYKFLIYDCRHWAKNAAKQCGLNCN